jgi:hypothetical protein
MSTTQRKPSGRGKAVLAIDWWPGALPDGTTVNLHTLIASDGEVSRGTLFTRGTSASVVCLMHPRQDMQRHPLIPRLLEAGHAVWAQASRVVGNDLTLVHESVLLDVAAGMELLRERGYERVTLAGVSGGAGLYSFYTEQSLASERIAETPAGKPSGLIDAPMPPPDRLVLIAPHPGQGKLLLGCIDGSVADESDPSATIAELDPYNPANGFSEDGASYPADFIERYREAQRARVARIDERAREQVAPILVTYRTDADPRCTDLSLDANDRRYGSVISPKPYITNFGVNGFGRLTTPDSWLSTWSGLSSNAAVARCLQGVAIPTLIIEYTGDCSVFPSDIAAAKEASAAEDLEHVQIRSTHFGRRLAPDDEDPIDLTARAIG